MLQTDAPTNLLTLVGARFASKIATSDVCGTMVLYLGLDGMGWITGWHGVMNRTPCIAYNDFHPVLLCDGSAKDEKDEYK